MNHEDATVLFEGIRQLAFGNRLDELKLEFGQPNRAGFRSARKTIEVAADASADRIIVELLYMMTRASLFLAGHANWRENGPLFKAEFERAMRAVLGQRADG
jgi:hypothetical protein